jgi:hypothetical protein
MIIRESTGNFFDFGPHWTAQDQKGLCLIDQFEQIPYSTEQGII